MHDTHTHAAVSMGRSRSTPGLVESKSQLNLVAASASCPDAGDEEAKKSLPDSPLHKGSGDAINSTRRDSDARTSDQHLDQKEIQHRSASSIINQSLPRLSSSHGSAQVLYPPPTYTSVTCVQPHPTDAILTQGGHMHSLLSDPSDQSSRTPAFGVTPATPTLQYLSSAGQQFFLTTSPTSSHGHGHRRTSSPGTESAIGPLPPPADPRFTLSPAHSFPCLPPESGITPRSRTPVPGELSQEGLIHEIRRLRERLLTLENENTSMSLMLSQQQWSVENRLAEIEQQICSGAAIAAAAASPAPSIQTSVAGDVKVPLNLSSPSSTTSQSSTPASGSSYDDSERNKESII